MFEALLLSIDKWKATKNERQKLQHAYLVLAVGIVLFAGIASLFNAKLGHNIVKLALIAGGAFLVNAVVWNLLQSSIIEKLPTKSKRR
ncbi:MAG TPA: hypothetical protein VLI54_05000 [Bacillota bacterium]|nr:hypothetical protein [Bacillota bacterium]